MDISTLENETAQWLGVALFIGPTEYILLFLPEDRLIPSLKHIICFITFQHQTMDQVHESEDLKCDITITRICKIL